MKATWVEASNLPEGEKVYLKKDVFGWRVVEPWKNEDGSINYFNLLLGGKRNLFILGFVMLIALFVYLGVNEVISNYETIAKFPCDFCNSSTQCFSSGQRLADGSSVSLPNLNLSTLSND